MRKIFSLLAAVLFAGSMMADSYTITFKEGSGTDSDSGTKVSTVADIISDGASYVSEVATATNVYNARIGRGIKLGTSKAVGELTLTLATPVNATSIVVTARKYNDTEKSFTIQGSDFTAGDGNDFAEYTYTYDVATEISSIALTSPKRIYFTSVTVNYEAGGVTPPVTLTEPAAAPEAPTYPANQVKAVYAATYEADCGFGEWGSGTTVAQEEFGKKYVTTGLGYFGLEFAEHLNCAKMEKLHMDVWVAADASIRIVPIWGGAEQGITVNLVGQQWNAVELALTAFDQVTNWTDVYQIKIDNAANLTFWLNNVYFYTTVAPAADTEAPTAVAASLVSASYFSAKISATATDNSDAVIFVVKDGENELTTAPAVSGVAKEITVNGLLPNTAYNLSVVAKDEAGNAAAPVAVAATTLAAPAPATAPTYAADKVLAIFADGYTNMLTEIQGWYAGPAISEGNLTATSKALCLEPNTTPSSCFGLAFAAVDASAFDALEMDVFATTENSVLKIQAIGIGEATTYNLVANQWNHIVLDIKGNTKADLQQVGFYDCHNLTGVVFIQNVLFVDTDEDAPVQAITCADVYSKAKNDVVDLLNPVVVTYANGKNVWVKDATASMLIYLPANGTYQAGDVLSGIAGVVDIYNGVTEIKPSADQVAAITVAAGDAPAAEELATVAATDVNKYIVLKNVDAEGEFAEGTQSNLTIAGVTVRNQFKNGYAFEAGKKYNIYGVVTLYQNNPQVYFISAEVAGTPVDPQTIDITISKGMMFSDAVASYGYWDIYGENENYAIELSNISTTEVPGVYTVEDLDADYSYVVALAAPKDTIHFTAGQVEVAVSAEGVVTVVGQLTGDDSNIYNINLTYQDPVAEKTVTVAIPEATLFTGYATYGLYGAYGYTADSATYVQLGIWVEQEFQGDFTEDDLDYKYIGSGLIDADGTQSIFSAAITVTPGNGEGVYRITADLLCYNNTLYKVTMQIGIEQGIEDVDAAVKAIKSIVNGQLIIEKNGVQYNAQGAVIR